MCAKVRYLLAGATLLLVFGLTTPAWAWVETRTKSVLSTVDIAPDGLATVSHELAVEVRGGPLRELELKTSDVDAEPLPDATVTKMSTGQPLPLLVERSADGALRLEIDHERGVRSGSYLFSVRYRTNLVAVERLRKRGGAIEASFIGPRLPDGVDGVRVIFRLPPASVAPTDWACARPSGDSLSAVGSRRAWRRSSSVLTLGFLLRRVV